MKTKKQTNKVIPKQTGNGPSNWTREPIHIYGVAYPVSKQNDVGKEHKSPFGFISIA